MTRRTLLILTSACLLLALAAVTPWQLPRLKLAEQLARQVQRQTGLSLVSDGSATITLLPVPRITLGHIALHAAEGARVLEAEQVRAELELWPLILGRRVVIANATVVAPVFHIAPVAVADLWSGLLQRIDRLSQDRAPHIGQITIIHGTLRDGRNAEIADDVDLVAKWPTEDADFNLAGRARWHGELVEIRLLNISPLDLVAGKPSPAGFSLSSPLFSVSLLGTLSGTDEPRIEGRISLKTPSLSDAMRWLGRHLPLAALAGPLAIDGQGDLSLRGGSIPEATLKIGDNTLDGALMLRIDNGRPSLSGTVAADTLDLDRFLEPLTPTRSPGGDWSGEQFESFPAAGDLDIRLSATTANLGTLAFDNVAGGVMMKAGRLEISVGRAALAKGSLKGRLVVTPSQSQGFDAKLLGSFEKIDAGSILPQAIGVYRIGGTAQGQIAFDASGRSFAELAASMTGKASFSLRQGEVSGLDLTDVARRVQQRPLSTALDWRGGRTYFDQMNVALAITNGVGELVEGTMTAATLRGSFAGEVNFRERQLNLRGMVTAPATAVPAKGFPLEITGSWDSPQVAPDIHALIERSKVTAPLFLAPDARGHTRAADRIEPQPAQ
ncbi:AsmA family protein [Chelatococcus sp. GCM10030263]|uniref:AsmA family protein n=1 Tax=Chelatococcus sp. GCM10030263 TaxID=3273387 RepID=UPI003617F627